MKQPKQNSGMPIQRYVRRYIFTLTIPLVLILVFTILSQVYYTRRYAEQLNNVTTASTFNQSFKENIDLKMYYYVTGSRYSDGLPLQEVEDAKALAENLLATTTTRESCKAINSVLQLCSNLESKILLISETESYDEQQNQLDSNIYILTSLVQEYMYNYLHSESVQLSQFHTAMTRQFEWEMVFIVLLGTVIVLLVLYYSLKFGRSLSAPLVALSKRVHEIGEGTLELEECPPIPTEVDEIQMLSTGFEQMVKQLREQIETRQKEEAQLRKTEFALLQAQINPHFLYNTLDTIIWLEDAGETEKSIEMVTSLSNYFRTALSKGHDIVTLDEELSHVRSYLEIQQVRYQDILDYEIHTQAILSEVMIPKLTLQPLVENALYHGVKLKRGKSRIFVTCQKEESNVRITVSDTGAGMTPERLDELRNNLTGASHTGFGFIAVHERLRLYFGEPYGLTVDSVLGEGTTVTALIPFDKKEVREG